ncbi:helix-turn-helix domain-containing protein [Streptomyces sp. L7]
MRAGSRNTRPQRYWSSGGTRPALRRNAGKFAAHLRMLKDRSGRGYDRLGKEAGVSGSSLHRYCSGLSVPGRDYRVVHAFAKVCGASAERTPRTPPAAGTGGHRP